MSKIEFKKITSADITEIKQLPVTKAENVLRKLREQECFSVVNRGELWYMRLTEEQKAEIDEWYQAWLDVTKTFEIPTRPNWLN